jgi:hypothetical protein
VVRAHAVWAAITLGGRPALAAAEAVEADPQVRAEYESLC